MKLATVEQVEAVWRHPNADALDFAKVLGYDCIVRRGEYGPGDAVVFIQPDTVLPADRAWAAEVLKYTKSGGRVRATRLRGEWSMGLVMPVSILEPGNESHSTELFSLGQEVSELLGLVAYEAPLPKDVKAKGGLPFGIPRTDEDRWQNLTRSLERWWGEPVDVTLKIDGSSFTAYCVLPGDHPGDEPAVGITSRSLDLKLLDAEGATNHWLEAARLTGVLDLLQGYCLRHGLSLALRGEVYGKGVQSLAVNPHSRMERGVAFFSTWNVSQRRYEGRDSPLYFRSVCLDLGLPTVPVLEEGVPLTRELLVRYDQELEAVKGQPFEGVVVKGSNFSFKVVNKHYDAKK